MHLVLFENSLENKAKWCVKLLAPNRLLSLHANEIIFRSKTAVYIQTP